MQLLTVDQLPFTTVSLNYLVNAIVEGYVLANNVYSYRPREMHRIGLSAVDLAKLRSLIPPPPIFNPSKPVQTRDGRAARVLCTDLKRAGDGDADEGGADQRTMVVAIMGTKDASHGEYVRLYTPDGYFTTTKSPCGDDIINVPEQSR